MKSLTLIPAARLAVLAAACSLGLAAPAAERVGVYDSRVVAYACFNTPENLAATRARVTEARAAQERGETDRARTLERQIKADQKRVHLQVFSTAPVPDALAQLAPRLEAVQRETGVARVVSKWDDDALRGVPAADRVDVTDALVRDLPLTDKQRATLRELATKKPLPLWQAKLMTLFGGI
jgi:hypothetical protein